MASDAASHPQSDLTPEQLALARRLFKEAPQATRRDKAQALIALACERRGEIPDPLWEALLSAADAAVVDGELDGLLCASWDIDAVVPPRPPVEPPLPEISELRVDLDGRPWKRD